MLKKPDDISHGAKEARRHFAPNLEKPDDYLLQRFDEKADDSGKPDDNSRNAGEARRQFAPKTKNRREISGDSANELVYDPTSELKP